MNIRVVRSGRRHKVGNRRIIEAMANAGKPTVIGDRLHYVGADSRGVELEVIAVADDRSPGGLAVIHAMPTGYRGEGANR
jgi:hypothetical protein